MARRPVKSSKTARKSRPVKTTARKRAAKAGAKRTAKKAKRAPRKGIVRAPKPAAPRPARPKPAAKPRIAARASALPPGAPIFTSPAPIPGAKSGSAPALAWAIGKLACAFQAGDGSNALSVTTSVDGTNWQLVQAVNGIAIGGQPALSSDPRLMCVFQSADPTRTLFTTVAFNNDAMNWMSPAVPNYSIQMGSAPALGEVINTLDPNNPTFSYCCAYQENNDDRRLMLTTTRDGINWAPAFPAHGPPEIVIGGAPALAVFSGPVSNVVASNYLYCVFQANDWTNTMFVTRSADGKYWSSPAQGSDANALGLYGIRMGSAAALASIGALLYCAFRSNDDHNNLCVTWTRDGQNWQAPAVIYPEIVMASAPSLAVFNNRLYLGFQGADHLIYVSSAGFPN